jgi:hypothetical protein
MTSFVVLGKKEQESMIIYHDVAIDLSQMNCTLVAVSRLLLTLVVRNLCFSDYRSFGSLPKLQKKYRASIQHFSDTFFFAA